MNFFTVPGWGMLPIAEIPRLTGFRTHSCLKTAFRKKFGISMAAYRKTQRSSPAA